MERNRTISASFSQAPRPIFRVGGRTVSDSDIVDAAEFRGDLKEAIQASVQEREITEVQEAADRFRKERDLITAEETEHWLSNRGITHREFNEYFKQVDGLETDYSSIANSPELRRRCLVELLMSGEFDRLAQRLAWRFAAIAEYGGSIDEVDFDALEKNFREIQSLCLESVCAELYLARRRLSYLSFESECLEIDANESPDTIGEILLCLRKDQLPMSAIARETGYPMLRRTLSFDSLPENSSNDLLGARQGDVLGPYPYEGRLFVIRLVKKNEPSLEDSAVRERIEHEICVHYFAGIAAKHVDWVFPIRM